MAVQSPTARTRSGALRMDEIVATMPAMPRDDEEPVSARIDGRDLRPGQRRVSILLRSLCLAAAAALTVIPGAAVTRAPSADGQFWDIQDTSPWSQDSGGIATGGRAYPFNGFGYLKLQVQRPDRTLLVRNQYLTGFGLAADGAGRFDSITPVLRGDIVVSRAIFARSEEHTSE